MVNAIGIDLGTSKCCVGVFRNGKVEIISNEFGHAVTPSYVAFTDSGPIIGDAAKNQVNVIPRTTCFAFLRLMGHKFKDDTVQSDLKYCPFRVTSMEGDHLILEVEVRGETKYFHPEEIVAMLLAKLKESAEAFLGSPVKDVVITVSADLNHCYHHAVFEAAKIAGLNVLRVVNAPAAAAITHIVEKKAPGKRHTLIFDFGAGTLDVSVVSVNADVWKVKSTVSDPHLGGEDVTNRLFDYFKAEFERKHSYDISDSDIACIRLRAACERVKRDLSTDTEAVIELESLIRLIVFKAKITRTYFEGLCFDIFQRIIFNIDCALEESFISNDKIDDVILLGGSSRIPKIQEMVSEYFGGRKLIKRFNTDEAAALGAAIQAALLSGDESEEIKGLRIPHVVPQTLGIEEDGKLVDIIKRDTPIPAANSKTITTKYDDDDEILIKVVEGNYEDLDDNQLLGVILLNGPPQSSGKETEVKVTVEVDIAGAITISALDQTTNKTDTISFPDESRFFSEEDMKGAITETTKWMRAEKTRRTKFAEKERLLDYCNKTMETVKENRLKRKLQEREEQQAYDRCKKALKWNDHNPNAKSEEYQRQLEEVKVLNDAGGESS